MNCIRFIIHQSSFIISPFSAVHVMRHFLDLLDLNADELDHLLADAMAMKQAHKRGERQPFLAGRLLGLVFEKPSLRTRVSFEAAMAQLGGSSIFFSATDAPLGQRGTVPLSPLTLSQYPASVALH